MSIYCKTLRTSETGLKFQAILNTAEDCHKAVVDLSKELGFTKWRPSYWSAFGGISSCIFPEGVVPDPAVWKKVNGDEFMPRLNCKAGKEISKKIESLPQVALEDLNMCVDFEGFPFKNIGFTPKNDTYFGFTFGEEWGLKIPADCTEITYTEYNQLFNSKTTKEEED